MNKAAKISMALGLCVGLVACAPGTEDPLEPINRPVHAFNKGVDTVILRPVSQVYGAVVPPPAQTGVSNFANNLGQPGNFVNYVLQGNLESAAHSFARFAVNSTFGLAGLVDVAGKGGMTDRPTDFGATLYTWGAPEGPYVEVPLYGGATTRQAVGTIADVLLDPLGRVGPKESRIVLAATGLEIVDLRHRFKTVVDALLYESSDSYAALRTAYLQRRRAELGQEVELEDLEDPYAFDDE